MNTTCRRFLIVGMQRSGTSVTREYLAGHPMVDCAIEEIHTAFFQAAIADPSAAGETTAERTASLLRVFDHLAGRREASVVGLKTALGSVASTARLAGCLRTHGEGIDLVVVRRRDLVSQLGSLKRAQRLGVWHRRTREQTDATAEPVTIELDELRSYVDAVQGCHALIDGLAASHRVLHLCYERDIATGTAWPKLCEFLRLQPLAPEWLTLRKASPPPDDYIANYQELARQLPDLLAAAAAKPTPAAKFEPIDSRVFLLHRAQLNKTPNPNAALADALAALQAPPDWGIESHEWACATIADALVLLDDPVRATAVRDEVAAKLPDDPHAAALVARIDDRLRRS